MLERQNLVPSSQPSSKVSEMYLFLSPCPPGEAGEEFMRSQLQSKKQSFPAGKARLVQGLEDVQLSWKGDISLERGTSLLKCPHSIQQCCMTKSIPLSA